MPSEESDEIRNGDQVPLVNGRTVSIRHNIRRRILKSENFWIMSKWLLIGFTLFCCIRYLPQIEQDRRNRKIILLWNDNNENSYFTRRVWPRAECGCVIVKNRSLSYKVNAIVVNADKSYSLDGIDRVPKGKDYFLVYSQTKPFSEITIPMSENSSKLFNLTMTYRADSDIKLKPYLIMSKTLHPTEEFSQPNFDFDNNFSRNDRDRVELLQKLAYKSRFIVYNIFEVNTQTRKKGFLLDELRHYMELDAYTTCTVHPECMHYKFMLILETTKCPDYISPDFYVALTQYIVPVVVGGANFSRFVPPHSYIDGADFESIKELSKYLIHLDKNPSEYIKYFWWHAKYKVLTFTKKYCALCKLLKYSSLEQSYKTATTGFNRWYKNHKCYNETDSKISNEILNTKYVN